MGSGGSSVKISLDKAHQSSLSAVILPPVAGLAYLFFQRTVLLCTESAHLPFFKQGLSSRSLSQPQACLSLSFNPGPPPQTASGWGTEFNLHFSWTCLEQPGMGVQVVAEFAQYFSPWLVLFNSTPCRGRETEKQTVLAINLFQPLSRDDNSPFPVQGSGGGCWCCFTALAILLIFFIAWSLVLGVRMGLVLLLWPKHMLLRASTCGTLLEGSAGNGILRKMQTTFREAWKQFSRTGVT